MRGSESKRRRFENIPTRPFRNHFLRSRHYLCPPLPLKKNEVGGAYHTSPGCNIYNIHHLVTPTVHNYHVKFDKILEEVHLRDAPQNSAIAMGQSPRTRNASILTKPILASAPNLVALSPPPGAFKFRKITLPAGRFTPAPRVEVAASTLKVPARKAASIADRSVSARPAWWNATP